MALNPVHFARGEIDGPVVAVDADGRSEAHPCPTSPQPLLAEGLLRQQVSPLRGLYEAYISWR